jgi:uncharacterized alkaline shock family protein YloU
MKVINESFYEMRISVNPKKIEVLCKYEIENNKVNFVIYEIILYEEKISKVNLNIKRSISFYKSVEESFQQSKNINLFDVFLTITNVKREKENEIVLNVWR